MKIYLFFLEPEKATVLGNLNGSTWKLYEYDTLELYCNVSGKPEPMLKWYHDNIDVETEKNVDFKHLRSNYTMTKVKLNRNDRGNYSCVASNKYGESTLQFIQLEVLGRFFNLFICHGGR